MSTFNLNEIERPGITLGTAALELTGAEVEAMKRHFGCDFDKIDATMQLFIAVWSSVNRTLRSEGKPSVAFVKILETATLRSAMAFFEDEPADFDPANPDSLAGKDA